MLTWTPQSFFCLALTGSQENLAVFFYYYFTSTTVQTIYYFVAHNVSGPMMTDDVSITKWIQMCVVAGLDLYCLSMAGWGIHLGQQFT